MMPSVPTQNKLKILCLHGFNNTLETIKFMTEDFRKMFDRVMEFYFVEAPHEVPGAPEITLSKKGFKGPFKQWFMPRDTNGIQEDNIIVGVEESMEVIIKAINENGPFDGFLCFSSGAAMFRMFYMVCNYIKKEKYAYVKQPKFVINIGGTMIPEYQIVIDDKYYSQVQFEYPIDAIQIYGLRDPFITVITPSIHLYTAKNTIIIHDKGHIVPRTFTDENFEKICSFIREKYFDKFQKDNGFHIEQFRQRL